MSSPTFTIGEVVKTEHRKELFVYSSGGGGAVWTNLNGTVSGYNRSANVSSKTVSTDVLWIRGEGGQENEFRVPGDTFACRESHRIGIIHEGDIVVYAQNFSSPRTVEYLNPAQIREAHSIGSRPHGIVTLLFGSIFVTAGTWLGWLASKWTPVDQGTMVMAVLLVVTGIVIYLFAAYENRGFDKRNREAEKTAQVFITQIEALKGDLAKAITKSQVASA